MADWYDDALESSADTFQNKVILPNLIRLLGKGNGAILDLACGQGFFAREAAKAFPAAKILASDISPELIELARKNPDPATARIEYHVSPASDLSFMADGSADAIFVSLAIQNIEDIAAVFAECARALKKGGGAQPSGRLILVMNHPAFRIPKRSSWQWEDSGEAASSAMKQYRRLDAYMSESSEKIDMTPGTAAGAAKEIHGLVPSPAAVVREGPRQVRPRRGAPRGMDIAPREPARPARRRRGPHAQGDPALPHDRGREALAPRLLYLCHDPHLRQARRRAA